MVTQWGMAEELGFISFGQEDEPIFLGKEIARHKDYSEDTAHKIDIEIDKILRNCMNETREILTNNRDKLTKIAERLVEKETLSDIEIREIIGLPPSSPAQTEHE
jgi:cell division protease FtsH